MNDTTNPAKTLPNNIILEKWADTGFFWQGELDTNELVRLCQNLDNQPQAPLMVSVTLEKQAGLLKLAYQVTGELQGVCQRCLSPLTLDVSGDYGMFILDNSEQMSQMPDEDSEFVLLDEVCPMEGRKLLPIKDLLEDELLLSLPLSLHHEDCEMLIQNEEIESEPKENPFAILAQLKGDK